MTNRWQSEIEAEEEQRKEDERFEKIVPYVVTAIVVSFFAIFAILTYLIAKLIIGA